MRNPPASFLYSQGVVLLVGGFGALYFGVVDRSWLAFSCALLVFALTVMLYIYLAWWRRDYEEGNPGHEGSTVPRGERIADAITNRGIRAVRPFYGRTEEARDGQSDGDVGLDRRAVAYLLRGLILTLVLAGVWIVAHMLWDVPFITYAGAK